nr:hypothetical protein [Atopobium sp. oral taxon 416]
MCRSTDAGHLFEKVGLALAHAQAHPIRSALSSLGPHFDMPAILWEAALDDCDGESPSQDVAFLPEQSLEKSHIFAQKVKAHLKPTPERHRSTLRAGASVHEDARGCALSIIAPYCSSVDFAARMSARSVACEPGLTRAQARSHAQKSTP